MYTRRISGGKYLASISQGFGYLQLKLLISKEKFIFKSLCFWTHFHNIINKFLAVKWSRLRRIITHTIFTSACFRLRHSGIYESSVSPPRALRLSIDAVIVDGDVEGCVGDDGAADGDDNASGPSTSVSV